MGREEIKSIKKNIQKEDSLVEKDSSDVELVVEPVKGMIDGANKQAFIITIYTTNTCNKCRMLKDYLIDKGIEFTEKDAVENYKEISNSMYVSAPLIKVETSESSSLYDMDGFLGWINDNAI